ncbi:MAG: response regulator [Candidatus Saccharibacteria bacterium]|nr:response regulator [Candidatus Saccharibacteria bacterium]
MTDKAPTILIVEDDRAIRELYVLKFQLEGFTVHAAEDGQQGLEKAKDVQPDLILLDIMMPVMKGDEMLALLRGEDWGSSIRVVILTNLSKDEAPQSLRFLHVDRYVVKAHHTPKQIIDIVNEILGRPTVR